MDPTTSDVWDTCFGILFLERATAPLLRSEGAKTVK
jgi:hypothetical protein